MNFKLKFPTLFLVMTDDWDQNVYRNFNSFKYPKVILSKSGLKANGTDFKS